MPPTTLPIAPAPRTPTRLIVIDRLSSAVGSCAYRSDARGLEVVELPSGAGRQARDIRREHDEVEPPLHRAGGERRARAVHARLDTLPMRRLTDAVAGREMLGIRILAA